MKIIVIKWKSTDSREQSDQLVGAAHPGCCSQDGGCPKKHG